MEVKPGYKQTEVGVIPADWEVASLGHFWNVIDCKHVTAQFVASGYPIASIKEVQSRFIDLTDAKQTTQQFYNLLIEGGRKPRIGDLILSRNATVGEVAQVAEWHPPFAMGQDVCLLRKKSSAFASDYLQAVFRSPIIGGQLSDLMVGSTFKRANVKQIKNFTVPMPSPAEQKVIAEVLSDAEALIECLEQLIAKKRRIKQGAMQELLKPKKGWVAKRMGEIADCLDYMRIPLNESERAIIRGDFPYCGANGVLGYINDYCVNDSVILMAEDGGYFDEYLYRPIAYRMSGKFWVNNHAHILKSKPDFDQDFLFYSLVHKNILSFLASGTRAKLNKSELIKIVIYAPAVKAEQTAIAAVLSDMDAEIAALEARLDKARQVKQGMIQELLTGRIRLV